MRVAAVQLEARDVDVGWNLEASERLADEAGRDGAECIVLPEFFTTGIGFVEALAGAALPPDGEATDLLRSLATRHGAIVGGSFLCRDADGEVRNAFLLATPDGEIAGRHDKDLPTMWENAFYVGGDDDGVIEAGDLTIGAAVCWELMRTQTVRRLRGRIDLALTGSGWWSLSENWPPRAVIRRLEAKNHRLAVRAAESFALYVGAPVIHAAHAGRLECPLRGRPCPTAAASRAAPSSATPRAGSSPTAAATRARDSSPRRWSPAGASRCGSPRTASGCTTVVRWPPSPGTTSASTADPGTASTSAAGRRPRCRIAVARAARPKSPASQG